MILDILLGMGIVAVALAFGDIPSKFNNNSGNLEEIPQTSILELPILG